MKLTVKQQEGLETAIERYKNQEKYTIIAGFAGTGKTTLVKYIVAALRVPEEHIVYCSYTGKAASVLSQKGCLNAMTLHRLLYKAYPNPQTGKFKFVPKTNIFPYKIVVIDEVSMIPPQMWKLLIGHDVHILALGDPGQLGPVKKDPDFDLLNQPHVFLDEIMRQAEGSEIISWSMKIRNGQPLIPFVGEEVQIIEKKDSMIGMLTWADQVICAKNATRSTLNSQIRQSLGMGKEPQEGDKVICLRNDWETFSNEGNPLVNGTIGTISNLSVQTNEAFWTQELVFDLTTETGDIFPRLTGDYDSIHKGEYSLSFGERTELFRKNLPIPHEFNYGYAITAWKAQGSEWDKILLIEENHPWEAKEKRRYLYTGITRASSKIVIVKK